MKHVFLVFLLIAGSVCADARVDNFGRRHYFIALRASNPLGMMSKVGGGLEFRMRSVSFMPTYYTYYGAYPSTLIGIEYNIFLRTRTKHEYYFYAKAEGGNTSYDRSKLTYFNYSGNDLSIKSNSCAGGGVGFGKRFNFNVFFLAVSGGFKYLAFNPPLNTNDQNLYRLFYLTGPGAIVDVHLQFGLQL